MSYRRYLESRACAEPSVRIPPAGHGASRGLGPAPLVERASTGDLTMLAADVGPAPLQVGAVLMVEPPPGQAGPDAGLLREVISSRVPSVPRLRQRLVRVPVGCGRPIWIDDAAFDPAWHIREQSGRPPGDETAVLAAAARILAEPLPLSRPPWSATVITGLPGARMAMVLVFHHVLADGAGGLALLASLIDGAPPPAPTAFPRPVPSHRVLAAEAWRSRLAGLAHPGMLLDSLRGLRPAAAELNPRAALPRKRAWPTRRGGPRRRVSVARVSLDRLQVVARTRGATVNDVVLTAIARALGATAASRGERIDELVVSIMVAGRAAGAAGLGNRIGVMSIRLPASGDRSDQLRRVAAITRAHKTRQRGASSALLGLGFRTLSAVGLLPWFINRQWLTDVFETNLRGPAGQVRFGGGVIAEIIPLTAISGNVTLSFGVISYAGRLTVAVTADPDHHPDLDPLVGAVQTELDEIGR